MFMTEPIRLSGLLAQSNDAGEWMELLLVVVVAAFWAIGGIVKAASAGRRDRQRKGKESQKAGTAKENLLQQLARKAEEFQRAVEGQGGQRPRRTVQREQQARRAKPAEGQVTVRTGRGGESVLVYEPQAETRSQPARMAAGPARGRPPRKAKPDATPSVEPPRPRPAKALPTQPVAREVSGVTSPLVDYSDADALKKAFIHYEVLAKPLAFRDPLERTSF